MEMLRMIQKLIDGMNNFDFDPADLMLGVFGFTYPCSLDESSAGAVGMFPLVHGSVTSGHRSMPSHHTGVMSGCSGEPDTFPTIYQMRFQMSGFPYTGGLPFPFF